MQPHAAEWSTSLDLRSEWSTITLLLKRKMLLGPVPSKATVEYVTQDRSIRDPASGPVWRLYRLLQSSRLPNLIFLQAAAYLALVFCCPHAIAVTVPFGTTALAAVVVVAVCYYRICGGAASLSTRYCNPHASAITMLHFFTTRY